MRHYQRAKIKIKVRSKLSEDILVQIKDLCYCHLVFGIALNVIIECARESSINKILYVDDLVLMR